VTKVLATLKPTLPRRILAAGTLAFLGALLIALTLTQPPAGVLPKLALPLIAALCLYRAMKIWRATERALELHENGLFDQNGELLVAMDNIASVDRSLFAFKPANGFLIRTLEPVPRGWTPGLWWRFGRRLGIGGVTPPGAAKQMADIIAVLLQRRDA